MFPSDTFSKGKMNKNSLICFALIPPAAAKNFCSVPSLECDFPLGLSVIQCSLYSHEDISTKKHFTGGVKQYDEPIGCLKHLSLFFLNNNNGTELILNYG